MQAEFGVKRESDNTLFYKEWSQDKGKFHFHSQIELYFVNEGEMEVLVGDQQRLLSAGEMSVALSFNPHGYNTPKSSASAALIIPTYMCEDFVIATREKRARTPFITNKSMVDRIKTHVKALLRDGINEIEREGHIYVILGIVMDALSLEDISESLDSDLSSGLMLYINENFRNEISLSSVATHFGYSQSYISRYFKSKFNITFNRYLNLIRLKNAVMLMHEKRHSIIYCALESGFSSVRTFYRIFDEEFLCSPKEFLKKC